MKLAVVGVLAMTAGVARAEASLDEYAPALARRPAEQLYEASCDLDLELRGAVASVSVRQRIVNPGPGPESLAASYELDLPKGATITGFSLRGAAGVEQALAVPGDLHSVSVAARSVLGADPGVLVALPPGSTAEYAVRLQPIEPDHDVVITLRYTALAEIRDSALRLVLPGRTGAGKLTACRGSIRAAAGPGASIQRIRVDGKQTTGAAASFTLDTAPAVIETELAFAGNEPVVWTQTEPLGDGWSATLVTVVAPPVRTITPAPRRALFVIDGSRSMELVGRHNVSKVIRAVAQALPAGTEVEAIIYDRASRRVFGAWQPPSAQSFAAIDAAVTGHAAVNGSDVLGAFKLAHDAITDGSRSTTIVIAISDGVTGDVDAATLTRALDSQTSAVDVLAIVLDPARTKRPGAAALRSQVNLYGGAFVEVNVDELDGALEVVDGWLRPSWLELELGDAAISASLTAGSGLTRARIHRGTAFHHMLTGHGASVIRIAPKAAPAASVAALVLAATTEEAFLLDPDPTEADRRRAAGLRSNAVAGHPYVSDHLALAVLTATGKVARARRAMVKGGGPYERIVAVADPTDRSTGTQGAAGAPAPPSASAIAKITLERLFREQLQPRAYACYQRALGTSPKLEGTVRFDFRLGRGEITEVTLTGLGEARVDACLLDAAYAIQLPLPDFTINVDDQTLAHYPLTFKLADSKPVIVLGDADSSSPLDIEAIEGGVPIKRGKTKIDASTPLGNLRPGKSP